MPMPAMGGMGAMRGMDEPAGAAMPAPGAFGGGGVGGKPFVMTPRVRGAPIRERSRQGRLVCLQAGLAAFFPNALVGQRPGLSMS